MINLYIYDLTSYALKNISLFSLGNDVHSNNQGIHNNKITQILFYSVDKFLHEDIL